MTEPVVLRIRRILGVTQQQLADALNVTQPNVVLYERGQTLPPDRGAMLIAYAAARGLALNFDHLYGSAALPRPARKTPAPTI